VSAGGAAVAFRAVRGDLVYFWIPVPDAERAKAF
jgi:predicted enzyme related to lactoylglutathione lyase